jgi:hypothetical protein
MCLKNKIIVAGFCALVAGAGLFTANSVAMAQTTSTSGMTIEQMQQLIIKLQQQIAQVLQLLLAQNKPVCGDGKCEVTENTTNCSTDCKCAVAGEKFDNGNTVCCSGLTKETTNPCGNVPCTSVLSYTCNKSVDECVKEGVNFTDTGKKCCAGLVKSTVLAATSQLTYACVKANQKVCTPNAVKGCRVCNAAGSAWVDTNSKCATGKTCWQGDCYACAKENETFSEEGRVCCTGLLKNKTNSCGNETDCLSVQYVCNKSGTVPVSKYSCTANADCVSDSGTCHECFNKTWWNAQTATVKASYRCDGIGDSICQCKSGTCTSVAICGGGIYNATYENSTNCASDYEPAKVVQAVPPTPIPNQITACVAKNNGCSYSGGFMTYDCVDKGGGNFVLDGCNNYCEPYGKCYQTDGTVVSVGVVKR